MTRFTPFAPLTRPALAGLALAAAWPLAGAASLRTVTDVWGGSGNGSIAAGCTTYGPIPDLLAFFNGGGFRVLGGNVACGYTGVTSDQTAATGPLLAQQTLAPVALDLAGSRFQGAAGARAAYGSLGVSARGTLVGQTGGTTATVAVGAAFFQDTLSASSPHVAPSAPGFVRYVFSVDGQLSASAAQHGLASLQLNLQQAAGPVFGLARLAAEAPALGTVSAIDRGAGTWLLGAGTVAGAGDFGSTVHVPFFGDVDLPMVWGAPWAVQVGLLASTGRSADASFLASARLVDIQLFDGAHQRITDATLSAASGTDYLAAAAVPEPGRAALCLGGLAVLALRARRPAPRGAQAPRGPISG